MVPMHLAHMALTRELLTSLKQAGTTTNPSRIVMTSSKASITSALCILGHDAFSPDFMVGDGEGGLRGEATRGNGNGMTSHAAYGCAKLCNNLFAFESNRSRMQQLDWPVIANTLHTGSVATKSAATALGDLFHGLPGMPWLVSNMYVPLSWRSPDTGASTLLFPALSDDPLCMIRGGKCVDALCRPLLDVDNPAHSKIVVEKDEALRKADDKWAAWLWNATMRLLEKSPAREVIQLGS